MAIVMDAEEANSLCSLDSKTTPMLFSSSTSFTIQHSFNLYNIMADIKVHKRRKQAALPRKKIYIEREKLRRMEISAPIPNSAYQDPRLHQTNEMQVKRNSNSYEMRKSPKRNAYNAELHPKQLTLDKVQQQEAHLAVRLFEDYVLPELKAHLPQPKSTIGDVLRLELQPRAADNQCTYASIYEIPPAAETWQRSDCLRVRSEEGLLNEVMQEINMHSISATYMPLAVNRSEMKKAHTNSKDNGSVTGQNRSSNETVKFN